MNKFVLALVLLLFLMSFTTVKAIQIFNVTGQTSNILNTNQATGLVAKQSMFCDLNYCYHFYSSRNGDSGSQNEVYASKWLRNSTYPFSTILNSNVLLRVNPTGMTFDIWDYDSEKTYMILKNGTDYLKKYWVYKENLTLVEDTDIIPRYLGTAIFEMEIDTSDFSLFYANQSNIRKLYYTTGYINSSIMSYYNRPSSINAIYIPEIQETYLFFINGSGNYGELNPYAVAYLYRLDNNYNVITYYSISTGSIAFKSNYASSWGYEPTSSLYAYYQDGIVYFALRQYRTSTNDNNNTWYVNAIDPIKTNEQNELIYSGGSGQYIDLSLYDSWLGNKTYFTDNQSSSLSFYYDNNIGKEQWYILYQRQVATSTYGGKEIIFLQTYKSCICSEWINVSYCGMYMPNTQYQMRTCTPYQCDNIGQYVDCVEPPPSINQKKGSQCVVCTTGEKKPQDTPQAKCSVSIEVPTNATNIKSNATWSIGVSSPFSFTSQDLPNYYRLIVCNPTENCFDQEYYCSQINVSQTWDYNNYQAGQIATSEFGIDQASSCKQVRKFLVDIGWSEYTVYGQLCLNYNVSCGGWICTSIGLNDYLQYENPDCSRETINSSNICINGCENNICLSEPSIPKQQENIAQSIGAPVGSLISMSLISMDSMFTSSDSKIVGATIITLCVGIGVTLIFKSKEGLIFGIISMLPMFFFFAVRGYYPIWIVLLVAIPSVAFIIVLMSGIKHTQGG